MEREEVKSRNTKYLFIIASLLLAAFFSYVMYRTRQLQETIKIQHERIEFLEMKLNNQQK